MKIFTFIRQSIGKYFYWIYLPFGVFIGYIQIFINSLKKDGSWLNLRDVNDKKKSDTIFILGSGESVVHYNHKQWDHISKCDSLGFNFWFLHKFIPTYYMFELPRNKKNLEDFLYNLNLISESYKNTLMFLKEGTKGKLNINILPDDMKHRIKVVFNPSLPIINRKQIKKALLFMHKIIIKNNHYQRLLIFNKRASLFSAVVFAYVTGYKNIVLCGIDLNNTSYFYDKLKNEIEEKGFKVPNSGQVGNVHRTDDNKFGEVTISSLIQHINEIILKPNNVNLYIGSSESSLSKWLINYWDVNEWKD